MHKVSRHHSGILGDSIQLVIDDISFNLSYKETEALTSELLKFVGVPPPQVDAWDKPFRYYWNEAGQVTQIPPEHILSRTDVLMNEMERVMKKFGCGMAEAMMVIKHAKDLT